MNLLWIISTLENGGAERVLLEVVNQLAKEGYNSTIFVLSNKISLLDDVETSARVIIGNENNSSIKFNMIKVSKKIYSECKRNDVIVGALEFLPTYFAKYMALILNKKNFSWFHTRFSDYLLQMNFLERNFAKLFYRNCKDIVFVTKSARDDFLKSLNKYHASGLGLSVIYNPVVHNFDESCKNVCSDNVHNEHHLLIVGRLEPVKNIEFMIDVFKELKRKGVIFSVNIVGDGSLYSTLSKKILLLGLEEQVNLIGYRKDLNNFYNNADFLIVPSLFEGFGGVVIEAYLNSLPVITFADSGGPAEILNLLSFGHVSNSRSKDLFAEELMNVLSNKIQYVFVPSSENEFNTKKIITKWITLIKGLQ